MFHCHFPALIPYTHSQTIKNKNNKLRFTSEDLFSIKNCFKTVLHVVINKAAHAAILFQESFQSGSIFFSYFSSTPVLLFLQLHHSVSELNANFKNIKLENKGFSLTDI